MLRWYYRARAVFGAGILFALLVMGTLIGASLLQAAVAPAGRERFLGGDLIVRARQSASLPALFSGAASPLPLTDADRCLTLLRTEPTVAAAVPFSAAPVILKSDLPDLAPLGRFVAVGVFPGTEHYYKRRLTFPVASSPAGFGRDLFLPDDWMRRLKSGREASGVPKRTFFLDSPRTADALNLTPVVLQGGFLPPEEDSSVAVPPVCFINAAALRSVSRVSLFMTPVPQNENKAWPPFRADDPFIQRIRPGKPRDYTALFSPGAEKTSPAVPLLPTFLLVSLRPEARAAANAFMDELNARLVRQQLPAVIEPVFPPAAGVWDGPAPWTGAAGLIGLFLIIIVVANLTFQPVVEEQGTEAPRPGNRIPRWHPSFLSRNFFIALIFGVVGLAGGTAFIPLYNFLAPLDLKHTLSSAFAAPLSSLSLPPSGLAAAAGLIAVFAVLTLPGPVLRARRMSKRLTDREAG